MGDSTRHQLPERVRHHSGDGKGQPDGDATLQRIYSLAHNDVQECARRLMIGGGPRRTDPSPRQGLRVWDVQGKS